MGVYTSFFLFECGAGFISKEVRWAGDGCFGLAI